MMDKESYQSFRKVIETEGNAVHSFSIKGSPMSDYARESFTQLMRSRLAKRPDLADQLIPNFAPGCRRLTPGPGFLEALTEDNVDFITTPIRAIVPKGVLLEDGRVVELDVLVCATGFDVMAAPPWPIIGLDGKDLKSRYDPYPEAYMSTAIDGFPNFFAMLGPNSGAASGSLTRMMEGVAEYIVKCIRKLQKEDIAAMHVSPRSVRDWVGFVDAYFSKTVFIDDCKTWYRKDNRIFGLWPGTTLHAIEVLKSPRWEDFIYVHADEHNPNLNRLAWMGNGFTEAHLNGGDIAYYIDPEHVDFPSHPLPENTDRWSKVAFSH